MKRVIPPFRKDLTGQRFGMLEVISHSHTDSNGSHWVAKCDCGKTKTVLRKTLIDEHTKSCGCKGSTLTTKAQVHLVYSDYVARSRKKKQEFALDKDEFEIFIKANCGYCDCEPSNIKNDHGRFFKYNGIDRIDSSVGYIQGNCVTCCKDCNIAKSTMTVEQFKNFIKRVYSKMFL